MTLTPNFLPVGSIVEYNYKNELGKMPVVVYGIHPPTPQKDTRLDGKWLVDIWVDGTTYITTPIDDISPISLTPEILTEWCGFEKIIGTEDEFIFKDEESRTILELTEFYKQGGRGVFYSNYPNLDAHTCIAYVEFLHQLQHLYSALTQTVLPITIK